MKARQALVGTRVKTRVDWPDVSTGTEGVIDEEYDGGVMVAWDLKDRPLPAGYVVWNGKSACCLGQPLRDGFSFEDLRYLEVVK